MKANDEDAINIFRKKKVLAIDELVSLLQCGIRTVRRRLKIWQARTSYNRNGRYYALPDIAKFDENGLWKCKKMFFSKFGNLRKTLVGVVERSGAGLNAFEIGELLGLPAHTFLSHFKENLSLRREKVHGLYVYFSNEAKIYDTQKLEREKRYSEQASGALPTDAEAIIILVELIKHPHDALAQLVGRVKRRGISVALVRVRSLLAYHGILKKSAL